MGDSAPMYAMRNLLFRTSDHARSDRFSSASARAKHHQLQLHARENLEQRNHVVLAIEEIVVVELDGVCADLIA